MIACFMFLPWCLRCQLKHYLHSFLVNRDRSVVGERLRFKQISWLPVAGRGPMPLSEQGESAVCQDCSYRLGAPTGAFCSALMAVLSPVPYPPQPHSSLLSAGPCASLGERRNPPLRPRTVESCLVRHYWEARALSCPYQSQGESVWLEDWNLNAIVSDFVTFLLGRVNPPLPAP